VLRIKKPLKHKYHAIPAELDGIKFPSKKEARVYAQLKLEKDAGIILFFLRQVPLHLPGGVKCVVDFVPFYADGRVRFLDAKGMKTATFKAKKRMVEALYPIEIECV
jgi:hypothetical protein